MATKLNVILKPSLSLALVPTTDLNL